MTAQNKGFRQQAKPTKAQVQSNLDQMNNQVRFLSQQLFQQMQTARQVQEELTAAINLLRLSNVDSIQEGDTVMIDTVGVLTETGKLFKGGYLQGTIVKVGSKNFVAGFEEALLGMKVGEQKDIVVTFPENYVEELKSKEAKFTTVVLKVWRASATDSTISTLQKSLSDAEAAEAKASEPQPEASPAS